MTPKPNIVFIMTDQYRFDCLSCLGHPVVKTPNLDKLVSRGSIFTNAHCATNACGPARASIFTGLYRDGHGQYSNFKSMKPENRPVLPEFLRQAGYQTALVGKLHLQPFTRDFGFDYFHRSDAPQGSYEMRQAEESEYIRYLREKVFPDENSEYPIRLFTDDEDSQHTDELRFMLGRNHVEEEHHITTWTVRESIKYLDDIRDPEKPFFLNLSFYGPHQPYLCPEPWASMYPPEEIPLPEDFHIEAEGKKIFRESEHYKWIKRRDSLGWNENTYRRILSAYYGNISMIDFHMGRLFEHMRKSGLWENSIVIFSSDHGEYGGQFKSFYKGMPYEGSSHVPLIIRNPFIPESTGKCIKQSVSNMDIFKTCSDAAGLRLDDYKCDSRSLEVLMRNKHENEWGNKSFYCDENSAHIVRDHYKLMKSPLEGNNTNYEFYDIDERPLEKVDHFGKTEYCELIEKMKKELEEWIGLQLEKRKA